MHRTEADGNASNLYSEGDASLSIPATVVSSAAANSWQEEIAKVVEGAGLTLLTQDNDTFDQLIKAIRILISTGGQPVPILQELVNNANNQDLQEAGVNIELDRTVVKRASFDIHVRRSTDTESLVEDGSIIVVYEPKNGNWFVEKASNFGDAGISFSVSSGSDPEKTSIQYSTSNLTGTSYFGELTLSNYKETRV